MQPHGSPGKGVDLLAMRETLQRDREAKMTRLRNLNPFILDNSIRETSVGSLLGHTLEDKWNIVRLVKMAGVQRIIVGSFSNLKRVDDQFVLDMMNKGVICPFGYAFSELRDAMVDGVPSRDVPLGMRKCRTYGLQNVIIECDLACRLINWSVFGIDRYCEFFRSRCEWVRDNLALPSRPVPPSTLINIRDFCVSIQEVPARVLAFVGYVGSMPKDIRPAGLMFEDPEGHYLPSELGPWVIMIRKRMVECGWEDGHFLVHIHHNYGLAQAAVLECLACGCDGMWAAVCDEGAATGHAGYLVTLANLARLGNTHVTKAYDMPKLLEAAKEITRIVSGDAPPLRQEVYGPYAPKFDVLERAEEQTQDVPVQSKDVCMITNAPRA